ncbi:SRPBCC family protein [Mycobacterium sp. URHB0021]|jgi:uncharacterized protein YndB with AHSA1/START domain
MDFGLRQGMLTVERDMAAAPALVWDVLTDLDAWPRWGPTVQRAELSEADQLGRGERGKVWTPLGVALPFTITEYEAGRHWAWQVAGIPATRHGVEPNGDGCRAWMGVPWWAPAYLAVCAIALQRIDRMTS